MSDNELDAELLAMAGDESSGDESSSKQEGHDTTRLKSSSPSKPIEPSLDSQQSVAKRKSDKELKNSRRRRRSDSMEDGEASASSANSVESSAMSELGSEAAGKGPDDDEALFPLEGKFHSQKDKEEIMAMSEIQREAILAERAQQVERRTQDLHLRRMLKDRERDEARAEKKRKATSADLEDSPRKSSRQKSKKNETLEMYNKERKERGKQRLRREIDLKKRNKTQNGPSDKSDDDADGESDVEWDSGAARAAMPEPEELPASLRDFERVRIGRTNFAKICFYPGFEDAIRGCFCRVSIGVDRTNGQNMYRMAQIKGFMEGKPYNMEGQNGMSFMTDQYAIVAHGKAVKEWPFIACSDSKFTEVEYEKFRNALANDNLKLSSRSHLSEKLDGIHKLLNRSWTEEDISYKLSRQNKYATTTRTSSSLSLQASSSSTVAAAGNASKIAASKGPSQADRLAALNKANRKANAEEVRKAQIAMKKAEAAARVAAAAKHARLEAEGKVADGEKNDALTTKNLLSVPGSSNIDDLFEGSDRSRGGTPGTGTMTPKFNPVSRSSTPLNGLQLNKGSGNNGEKKGGLPATFRKRNMDDDLIASLDLGIEIDI